MIFLKLGESYILEIFIVSSTIEKYTVTIISKCN